MDPNALIPLAAIIIGIPGFVVFTTLMVNHTRKLKELEIREKEVELGSGDAALGQAVDALHDDLTDVRAQLAEVQERLDFTERLLASGNGPDRDGAG
ncbi:MAG TPA: hypothetical protein VFN22_06855 [Gemmatimonadales bacterium]|nr:hypothetical protein [Gemmatimonadales bacterium]